MDKYKTALQVIADRFKGIDYDELSQAEKQVLCIATRALDVQPVQAEYGTIESFVKK